MVINRGRETIGTVSKPEIDSSRRPGGSGVLAAGSAGEKVLICSMGQFAASNSFTTSLQNS